MTSSHRTSSAPLLGRRTILVAMFCGLFSAGQLFAERYLTVSEAQKLCFPQAERFEERRMVYKADDRKAIEQRTGSKLLIPVNRYWLAMQGTNLLGVMVVDHVLGKHEIIDYAAALAPDGKVRQIEVLEYRESHGYEIRSPKWRDQFKGKDATAKLRLNEDIYNISGATISCRHVADGIKRLLAAYELMLRPQLISGGLLPEKKPASPTNP